MKYKDVLKDYLKDEEVFRIREKQKKLEKFNLFTSESIKKVEIDSETGEENISWEDKITYEEVGDEELARLEEIESKLNKTTNSNQNRIINFSNVISNFMIGIASLIGFFSIIASIQFIEWDPIIGFSILFFGLFSVALILSISSIIKLLISLNLKK